MSQQKDLLREIAAATSQGGVPIVSAIGSRRTSGSTSRASRLCRWDMRGQAKCGRFQGP